jgi:hypothetical protein
MGGKWMFGRALRTVAGAIAIGLIHTPTRLLNCSNGDEPSTICPALCATALQRSSMCWFRFPVGDGNTNRQLSFFLWPFRISIRSNATSGPRRLRHWRLGRLPDRYFKAKGCVCWMLIRSVVPPSAEHLPRARREALMPPALPRRAATWRASA